MLNASGGWRARGLAGAKSIFPVARSVLHQNRSSAFPVCSIHGRIGDRLQFRVPSTCRASYGGSQDFPCVQCSSVARQSLLRSLIMAPGRPPPCTQNFAVDHTLAALSRFFKRPGTSKGPAMCRCIFVGDLRPVCTSLWLPKASGSALLAQERSRRPLAPGNSTVVRPEWRPLQAQNQGAVSVIDDVFAGATQRFGEPIRHAATGIGLASDRHNSIKTSTCAPFPSHPLLRRPASAHKQFSPLPQTPLYASIKCSYNECIFNA